MEGVGDGPPGENTGETVASESEEFLQALTRNRKKECSFVQLHVRTERFQRVFRAKRIKLKGERALARIIYQVVFGPKPFRHDLFPNSRKTTFPAHEFHADWLTDFPGMIVETTHVCAGVTMTISTLKSQPFLIKPCFSGVNCSTWKFQMKTCLLGIFVYLILNRRFLEVKKSVLISPPPKIISRILKTEKNIFKYL